MRDLAEGVAVVTGASSGIGAAIALGLAAEGAIPVLVGRRREALDAVARTARPSAPRVAVEVADLTLDEDVRELAEHLRRDFERVDVLVHSAGVIALSRLDAAPLADLDRQYRTNVRAPFALTQALLPLLRRDRGQVVFINSSAGLGQNGGGPIGQYAATKHALRSLADSLRGEVNALGIRVLSVYLGRTATPMQERVHRAEGRSYRPERLIQPQDVAAVVVHALCVPRTSEVTDIHIRPLRKPDGEGR